MTTELHMLTSNDLRGELLRGVNSVGGQSAWSRKHGIAQSTLSQVLSDQREPTEAIINALGYTRVTRYVRMVEQVAA